jgi:hypothetical protein
MMPCTSIAGLAQKTSRLSTCEPAGNFSSWSQFVVSKTLDGSEVVLLIYDPVNLIADYSADMLTVVIG